MPGATAVWAVDLLTLYVTALAAEKRAWQTQDDAPRPMALAIGEATAVEYPHIHALRESLFSGEGARFDWALDVLLAGMGQCPLPPAQAVTDSGAY